jgi:hypothetical protein
VPRWLVQNHVLHLIFQEQFFFKDIGSPMADHFLYMSIVGAFLYATISRPNITYTVNKVSQFMQHPIDAHWDAVK